MNPSGSSPPNKLYDQEQHPLHRATGYGKAKQHAQYRVPGLEEKIFDADMEMELCEVDNNLSAAIAGHREADDWDLLGQEEVASSAEVGKKLA